VLPAAALAHPWWTTMPHLPAAGEWRPTIQDAAAVAHLRDLLQPALRAATAAAAAASPQWQADLIRAADTLLSMPQFSVPSLCTAAATTFVHAWNRGLPAAAVSAASELALAPAARPWSSSLSQPSAGDGDTQPDGGPLPVVAMASPPPPSTPLPCDEALPAAGAQRLGPRECAVDPIPSSLVAAVTAALAEDLASGALVSLEESLGSLPPLSPITQPDDVAAIRQLLPPRVTSLSQSQSQATRVDSEPDASTEIVPTAHAGAGGGDATPPRNLIVSAAVSPSAPLMDGTPDRRMTRSQTRHALLASGRGGTPEHSRHGVAEAGCLVGRKRARRDAADDYGAAGEPLAVPGGHSHTGADENDVDMLLLMAAGPVDSGTAVPTAPPLATRVKASTQLRRGAGITFPARSAPLEPPVTLSHASSGTGTVTTSTLHPAKRQRHDSCLADGSSAGVEVEVGTGVPSRFVETAGAAGPLNESTDSLLDSTSNATRPLAPHLHLHTTAGRELADVMMPPPARATLRPGGDHVAVTLVPEAVKPKGRPRVRWSEEEVQALREGHAEFGSSWALILARWRGVFAPHRTSIDLKDKWRNLQKEE